MAKLPLTKPIYMAELGRRLGMPSREARRHLRRLEHARKVRLLFKTKRTQRGRLWTTEALITKFCEELIDRPKRITQETRAFVRAITEKLEELREDFESIKASNDQSFSELRAEVERLKRETTRDHESLRTHI